MKLYQYALTLLLMSFGFSAAAQDAVLKGKISSNGKPVEGANVFIKNTSKNTVTTKSGTYQLDQLEVGKSYTIVVFAMGLKTQEKPLTAKSGVNTLDFSMAAFEEVLQEVSVRDYESSDIVRLNAVEGTAIYEGKKSEVIVLNNVTANLATNNSRQVYNKVPGLNIWESDGAGLQLGIGGRGLSPNRTSNFNTRQNGYDIAADALGYPESYYTPPLESVEKIQLVRGAAAMQYGTQFGGMLNFVMKEGNPDKKIELVSRQTAGSFGLFNSFNSLGGTVGKVSYYTFYQYKRGDGWRPNSEFEVNTAYGNVTYNASEKFKVGLELTHMDYLAKQPGGLTDPQFALDPRASYTDKNWFKIDWNIAAILMEYKLSNRSKLQWKNFGLYASREALGINLRAEDPQNDPRLLVDDNFRNIGSELRFLQRYNLGDQTSVLLVGARYYRGFDVKMQGDASNGKDADFSFTTPDNLLSDHDFYIKNFALFAENIFNISDKFSITPGIRFERIGTIGEGYYQKPTQILDQDGLLESVYVQQEDSITNYRSIFMAGIGASFKPSEGHEIYANLSQNYRAITFSDLRTLNSNVRVDPDLQDEKGYSADIGARGTTKLFNYDISLFYLRYNDKIGLANPANPIRTNISDAYTLGMESYAEINLMKLFNQQSKTNINLFSNIALIRGRYISDESIYDGNEVELVPPFNFKTGLNVNYGNLSASWQYSYVAKQYTDALNTQEPLSDAVYGPIPAYYVTDLSLKYRIKKFTVESGINNLTDNMYFTRRATGYPGPGIIPSDGRNFYLTLQVKI
ncbi:TonB-dependent receptor [Limibacter armeniacum]|uniref:TonB-dependent receptor n=1 Tax=Limibacter armeniacum TaxID=466084 RepID=UPI002FE519C5